MNKMNISSLHMLAKQLKPSSGSSGASDLPSENPENNNKALIRVPGQSQINI